MRAKTLLFSLIFLCPILGYTQPDTLWSCRFSYGTPGLKINGGAALADDGSLVVGVNNPEAANQNMLVARIDSAGQVVWIHEFGRIDWNEQANAATELPNGDIVLAGYGGIGSDIHYIVLIGLNADGDSLWYRSYYGQGLAKGNDVITLENGNFAVCGYRLAQDGQRSDAWVLKCASNGDTLWTRMFGGNGTDIAGRIMLGPNGNLYVGAYTTSWGAGDYDIWLLRLDSSGNLINDETFGTAGQEICYGSTLSDGDVYLAGRSGVDTDNDGYLVRTDSSGASEWTYPYDFDQVEENIRGVALRTDGIILCAGWSGNSLTSVAPWILTVRPDGTAADSYVYSTMRPGRFVGLVNAASGGYVAYGHYTAGAQQQALLMRLKPGYGMEGVVRSLDSGEPLPGARVTEPGTGRTTTTDIQGRFIIELDPGTYDLIAGGRCVSTDTLCGVVLPPDTTISVEITPGIPRYLPRQTSINMVVQNRVLTTEPFFIRNMGSGPLEFWATPEALHPPTAWLTVEPAHGFVPPADSTQISVLVLADTPDDGVYDYFGYLDIHANSCPDSLDQLPVLVTVLDAAAPAAETVREFALHEASPNPFNAVTTLSFAVPQTSPVRLTVYEMTGRLAATLTDAEFPAGEHRINFDAAALPSGMYLARMEAGNFSATRKLLLLK
ncbi:MAG: carboxypeptidase regulatory-like domain-containing protein [bacterium]|nr:carboxypeptidase regulatory-like domain-containing protein [bacterium]